MNIIGRASGRIPHLQTGHQGNSPHCGTWSRRGLGRAALAAAGLVLAGCSDYGAGLPPVAPADPAVYRLGPGDQVRIITFGEQQLTGEFRVDAAGDITLPLVGPVRAAGLTPRELQTAVTDALSRSKLYRNPSVSLEVINYRPIFILGEVAKPGQYPYQPGMTVLTAVAIAGGFTYRAVTDRFSIVRTTRDRSVEGRAERASPIEPGDVISVYERVF
ncbi:MAG: polysaccharide export protein [Acetobacteraceae bacterium]|nr:polysaccharide export protein [Acetobacteraceae bacterium]